LEREKICPLLRPLHISQILSGYKLNITDSFPVSKEIIEEIVQVDSTYTDTLETFDPNRKSDPLHFNFTMEKLNLDKLEIPKIILDKPGFHFLSRSPGNYPLSPW